MKKICVRCQKFVEQKEDYYKVETYSRGILIATKYIHRFCSDEINKQRSEQEDMMKRAEGLMKNAKGMMSQLGFPEDEKKVILEFP